MSKSICVCCCWFHIIEVPSPCSVENEEVFEISNRLGLLIQSTPGGLHLGMYLSFSTLNICSLEIFWLHAIPDSYFIPGKNWLFEHFCRHFSPYPWVSERDEIVKDADSRSH